MHAKIIFGTLAALGFCTVYGVCATPLPLPNADFENGAEFWTRRFPQQNHETVVPDPDNANNHAGRITLKANDALDKGRTAYFARRDIKIRPDTAYRIHFRIRTELQEGTAGPYLIFLENGKNLASWSHAARKEVPEFSGQTPWKNVVFGFVSPPRADTMLLQLNASRATGSVWFDDLKIEELSAAERKTMEENAAKEQLAAIRRAEDAKRAELAALKTVPVPAHPFVFAARADIERARRRAAGEEWAKKLKDDYLQRTAPWLEKSYRDIQDLVPPYGALYVYGLGLNLDPVHRQRMKWRGWSDPHHVEAQDGTIYPNAAAPDSGNGWTNPKDGQPYYFTAMANGSIMTGLTFRVLPDLANAYALTGDERYAERALWILDAIATIYPRAYEGPLDYPGAEIGKPDGGRLERPYYQAARALIRFGFAYDMVAGSTLAKQLSWSNEGLTAARNIELNLLLNGADYCLRMVKPSRELNNGVIDYNSGVLVAGALLGIPEYVEWSLHGPLGFTTALANTIDANGRYYESSPGYAQHTRGLLLTTAQLLRGMRLPDYPQGYNAYDDARFRRFALEFFSALEVAGRLPEFDDGGPDRKIVTSDDWFDPGTLLAAGHFYANSTQPATKREALEIAFRLIGGQSEEQSRSEWDLYHAPDWNAAFQTAKLGAADLRWPVRRGTLFHENGVLVLRSGAGANERAALLRYGPTLNHGQLDELGLQFYARGREFSGDPGYYNTHYRFGFTSSTVAHNTVVVNRHNQLKEGVPGGDLLAWNAGRVLRSAEIEDADAYRAENVQEYHRRVALLDLSPQESYIVDTFWLRGGREYDYSLHGLLQSAFKVLSPGVLQLEEKRAGSVAGPEINYKLTATHRVEAFPDAPFYFAPPGQGYGFLNNPAFYRVNGPLELEWSATDGTGHNLYVTHFAPPQAQIILADSPRPVTPPFETTYLLSRKSAKPAQRVRYTSVIHPTGGAAKIGAVTELKSENGADESVVALRIAPQDETPGEHLYFADPAGTSLHRFAGGIAFQGKEAFARFDAKHQLQAVSLSGAGRLQVGDFQFSVAPLADRRLKILEIRRAPLRLRIESTLPDARQLVGSIVRIAEARFARPVALRVANTQTAEDGKSTWLTFDADSELVSTGMVRAYDAARQIITTDAPFSRARPHTDAYDPQTGVARSGDRPQERQYNRSFDGYRVATKGTPAASGTIQTLTDERTKIHLMQTQGTFQPGTSFEIAAFAVGDAIEIPAWAEAERDAQGQWTVRGPAVARVIGE